MPVYGRTHHDDIGLGHLLVHLVELVALKRLAEEVDAVVGEVERFIFVSVKQCLCQSRRVAVAVGTAVDEQNLLVLGCIVFGV